MKQRVQLLANTDARVLFFTGRRLRRFGWMEQLIQLLVDAGARVYSCTVVGSDGGTRERMNIITID